MKKNYLTISEAASKFKNDYDLGDYLNRTYRDLLSGEELAELVKTHPNYYDLGEIARSISNRK